MPLSTLFFTCFSVPRVEHWGRRGLMLLSTFGQFLSFLIITILLRFTETSGKGSNVASPSIAFFFLFYISFGLGILGIPWLYPTEISSLSMRTKSTAVPTATNCIGWNFWIVWTVFNAAFLPVLYFFYPETGSLAAIRTRFRLG
ncbi:hypothetical protein NUU61_002562 [Penicillium alfredii]|uniref:Major facilitator superfamily (MFS) profile domain-containing protein n=1 Tax=Penicillium alfredii TaxID=1506179 RepID=A0A9W9FSH0_9EURO|nr:uncharacterized protein NUU61_002562 [Penicillium alfredii]KAJ5105215.1 hypothetical protein NUU61_002562 [Penicillium alfredii]